MEKYRILLKASAIKELRRLPKKDLAAILERIGFLHEDPRPAGAQKLSARERYRIRRGDYRIVYSVDDRLGEVMIYRIGHRSEVYRRGA